MIDIDKITKMTNDYNKMLWWSLITRAILIIVVALCFSFYTKWMDAEHRFKESETYYKEQIRIANTRIKQANTILNKNNVIVINDK